MSSGIDAAFQLVAETLQHVSSFQNPGPTSEITLTASATFESQWDSANTTEAYNTFSSLKGCLYWNHGTKPDVEFLPKLSTNRTTVDAISLNQEQASAITILPAYL